MNSVILLFSMWWKAAEHALKTSVPHPHAFVVHNFSESEALYPILTAKKSFVAALSSCDQDWVSVFSVRFATIF